MKNLLIIAQMVDANDDHRSFFLIWIKELAKHFDKVSVITVASGSYDLPTNVKIYSLGKEKGSSKFLQAIRFYWYLAKLLPSSVSVFAHASPVFVIASWPMTFFARKKIILWYLHRSVTMKLKIAEKLCFRIVTASKDSLGIKSPKIIELGHGIDTELFKANRNWQKPGGYIYQILSIGRVSPIKDYETLIETSSSLKEAGFKFKIKIVGKPVMAKDYAYKDKLDKKIIELGLSSHIEFIGAFPYSEIPDIYRSADILVNLAPEGGLDKTVLEAMASGCLILTSNKVFNRYLGDYTNEMTFMFSNPEDLSSKLRHLFNISSDNKKQISEYLVSLSPQFSITGLMRKLVAQLK